MGKNQVVYENKVRFLQDLKRLGNNVDIVESIKTAPYGFKTEDGSLYLARNMPEMMANVNRVFDTKINVRASRSGIQWLVVYEDYQSLIDNAGKKKEESENKKEESQYSDATWLSENLTVSQIKEYFKGKGIDAPTTQMRKEDLITYYLDTSKATTVPVSGDTVQDNTSDNSGDTTPNEE